MLDKNTKESFEKQNLKTALASRDYKRNQKAANADSTQGRVDGS
jgi:hypothetical protein